MNQLLLEKFKDYVNVHYLDPNITTTSICYDLQCSRSHLHEILIHKYGYSIMKYVEYFRILKSIEYICQGERKVYLIIGYNSSSVFSKSFLRITGLNARYFFHYQLAGQKNIMRTAHKVARENPKEAIEIIIKDVSITYMPFKRQKYNKGQKNKTKRQLKFGN